MFPASLVCWRRVGRAGRGKGEYRGEKEEGTSDTEMCAAEVKKTEDVEEKRVRGESMRMCEDEEG